MNDEHFIWTYHGDTTDGATRVTPEERWRLMRKWVAEQILPMSSRSHEEPTHD